MTAKPNRAQRRQTRSEQPYYKWIVLGTVVFSLLVILLDITVVNVSIPHIIRDFHTDISNIQWVFNAYTLAFASLLITFGRLADMFGHKRMFMIGLVTFGIGSALSGASPNVEWLIVFRTLQGIGGAMMMPATLSLMLQAFPPHQRGAALGFWGATAGVALAIGPTLGGFITDHYSWRWIFYINIPVVLLALFLTTTFIHQSREHLSRHKLDVAGFATVTAGLVALTYAIIEGPKHGWGSALIVGLLAAAVVLLAGFTLIERRVAEPMVNLKLFRSRNFSAGSVIALLVTFSMLGSFFLIPIYLQQVVGFSAVKTGLALTPISVSMLIVAPIVGKLSDKYGGGYFLIAGLSIASFGLWLMSHFTPHTTSGDLILPFAIFGFGLSFVMPIMINVTMDKVPPTQYGAGSGMLNTFRQVGGVLGIAIIGTVFSSQLAHDVPAALAANPDIPKPVADKVAGGFGGGEVRLTEADPGAAPGVPEPAKVQAAVKSTIDEQVTKDINRTFRFGIIFTVLGALVATQVRHRPQPQAKPKPKPTVQG